MTITDVAGSLSLEEIDIHSTEQYRDRGYPWAAWERLRAEAPVYWYDRPGIEPFWAITRHEDIHWVSSNDKLFINGGPRLRLASIEDDQGMWERRTKRLTDLGWDLEEPMDMVFMDRPRHTKFRLLTARRFTPRAMRDHEEHLAAYAARFTAEFEGILERDGEADLVLDYAVKLPLATICDLMGLPVDDWEKVHRFTEMAFNDEENMRWAEPGETMYDLKLRMSRLFSAYIGTIIEGCQGEPRDDLAGAVVHGEVDGCPLNQQQLTGYITLLLGAGNETTRNATTAGLTALLRHRDQIDRLLADESLIEPAVEEILRWTSPVIQFARTVTADVELHGQQIRAGDTVGVFYPSANRDESVFDHPERFDVGRHPNHHMAFGHGVHFCLGANLARWELRAMLKAVLPLLPQLELVDEPERHGHLHIGAVKHQRVRLVA
ncbi:cytochrome P450 [Candidatus Poriferisocius sp.]|uniref:cytochrome P450 n=1 Tax=Candidatus Poriferisocius sp. TaxID=3101276 RepID=UPI003B5A27A4